MSRLSGESGRRFGWVALVALGMGAGCAAEGEPAEGVRAAADAHVEAQGGRMTFDDPRGDGSLTLEFDYVHDGMHPTEGGRQVVCVDFKSANGEIYDVDFYVDRSDASGDLVVEDAVVHKVGGENVLSTERRAELDAKG